MNKSECVCIKSEKSGRRKGGKEGRKEGGRKGLTVVFRDESKHVVGSRGRCRCIEDHGGSRSSSNRRQDTHLQHQRA